MFIIKKLYIKTPWQKHCKHEYYSNTVLTLFFFPNFPQYFRRSTLSAVLNFIEPFVVSADFTLIPHNSFQGFTTQQNTRKRVHFIPDILHIVFISIKTLEHHPVFLKTEIKSAHFNKNKPTSIGIMALVHNCVHIIRCDVITYPFLYYNCGLNKPLEASVWRSDCIHINNGCDYWSMPKYQPISVSKGGPIPREWCNW